MNAAKSPLVDQEKIRFYEENGFLRLEECLTSEDVEDLRNLVERYVKSGFKRAIVQYGRNPEYDKVFHQVVNVWRESEDFRRHVFNPRLAEAARLLSRSRAVRLWHDHLLIKPPKDSKPTTWHQDLPYWPMREEGALSCWIPLQDVDERNGTIMFIPGSHRVGRLPPIDLARMDDVFKYAPQLKGREPYVAKIRVGGCTFHHGLTIHGNSPNITDEPRVVLAIIYMPDGITYLRKPNVVTDPLNLREGQPLSGEAFPILAEDTDIERNKAESWSPLGEIHCRTGG